MALLFGVHENIDPAATVARVGGNATRVFTPGVIAPRDLIKETTAKCGPTWAAGQTAVWSLKPDPASVANSAWRRPVEDLADFLRDNPAKKTLVVIWHEPENDTGSFARPEDFVRLFDTFAGWLRGKNPQVLTAHAALAYRYGDNIDITDAVAPRWRTSADIHCADVYSGRSNPLDTTLPELSAYRRWRTLVARDSRWGITERGWTISTTGKNAGTPAQRVNAMTREAAWLQALPAAAQPDIYLLWNTGGTENDGGLVFDADADKAARLLTTACAAAIHAVPAPSPAPAAPGKQAHTITCPLCAGSGKYTFTA